MKARDNHLCACSDHHHFQTTALNLFTYRLKQAGDSVKVMREPIHLIQPASVCQQMVSCITAFRWAAIFTSLLCPWASTAASQAVNVLITGCTDS